MAVSGRRGNPHLYEAIGAGFHAEIITNREQLPDAVHRLELLRDHIRETIDFTFSAKLREEMSRTLVQIESDIQRLQLQMGRC